MIFSLEIDCFYSQATRTYLFCTAGLNPQEGFVPVQIESRGPSDKYKKGLQSEQSSCC